MEKKLLERVRSGFSVEIVLSDGAEIFRRGTLLCRREFRVSKKFLDKNGVGNHDTLSKSFCLTVPSSFIDEPFCVSEQFGLRKILWQWGKYHDFLSKVCCLTIPKKIVSGTLLCPRKMRYRKFSGRRGGGSVMIFRQFFLSQCQNFCSGCP